MYDIIILMFLGKKLFICILFVVSYIPLVFSEDVEGLNINHDNFNPSVSFQEKVEFYRNSFFHYENTIDDILRDERENHEAMIDSIRQSIYDNELENLRGEIAERLATEIRDALVWEYEEKKKAEVQALEEGLQKKYQEEFELQKVNYEAAARSSLEKEYNQRLEAGLAEAEKTIYEKVLSEFTEVKSAELKSELSKEYEAKKNDELLALEVAIEKKYSELFETNKENFILETRDRLVDEYDAKKKLEIDALQVHLKKVANEENHSYTERFKIVAFYVFILLLVVAMIICIVKVKSQLKLVAEKRRLEKEQKRKDEESKAAEAERERKREQEECEIKEKEWNAQIRYYEEMFSQYLQNTGNRAALLAYFDEHGEDSCYSVKFEAYQRVVKEYDQPER